MMIILVIRIIDTQYNKDMKFFSRLFLLLALMPLASFVSCSDEEGEGGKSKITGTIYKVLDDGDIIKSGDSYSFVRDTIVATDYDVFIIYGSDQESVCNDDTKTSHNGKFEFDYLKKGNYSVYAYSDDGSYVMNSVQLGKNETANIGDIYVFDGKNSGKAGVVGKVSTMYASVDDEEYEPSVGTRVYIKKVGQMKVDDTRADDNAEFYFAKLDPNTEYVVWVERESVKKGQIVAFSDTVTTGNAGEIVAVKTLHAKVF